MRKFGYVLVLLAGAAPLLAQSAPEKPSPAMELAQWRGRIDTVDREIVALLNQRAEYVLKLAPLKREIGVGVQDAGREDLVLQNLRESNGGPLPDELLESIYRAVMAAMRDLQSGESQ